jgi:hypothetical protein
VAQRHCRSEKNTADIQRKYAVQVWDELPDDAHEAVVAKVSLPFRRLYRGLDEDWLLDAVKVKMQGLEGVQLCRDPTQPSLDLWWTDGEASDHEGDLVATDPGAIRIWVCSMRPSDSGRFRLEVHRDTKVAKMHVKPATAGQQGVLLPEMTVSLDRGQSIVLGREGEYPCISRTTFHGA